MFSHEEEKLGKIYDSQIVRRIMKFLGRDSWMIAVAALMGLVVSAAVIFSPLISQRAIDRHLVKIYRLVHLSAEEARKHSRFAYHLADSTYALSQEYMAKLVGFKGREVDRVSYYLLSRTKAERNLPPEVVARYRRAGEDKLLVPYEELVSDKKLFPRKLLVVLRDADWRGLIRLALLFVGIGVVRLFASFGQFLVTFVAGQRAMHRLRTKIFAHLERLSVRFFDRNPVGRLVTRTTNDVETLSQFFSDVVTSFFYDGFTLIGLIVALPIINWRLALVTFAIIPPMLLVTVVFRRKLRDAFRKVRVRIARINAFLNENLSGIKVVQIFRRERKRLQEFHKINESYFEAHFSQMMVFAVFRPLIDVLAYTSIAAILWFSGLGAKAPTPWVTLGFLALFLRYATVFFDPIRDLAEKFQLLQQAMASGERIFMLLDEKEERYDGRPLPRTIRGEIEFRNVWFAYNDEDWVLKDISFKVKPGERVAFVGATGAGKTSIINTLCRFYEIQKGKILVDGMDASRLDKRHLRSKIGIVMQDVFLFLGDIETNIRLRSDIPRERLEAAARVTNAERFISKLPKGYNAPVEERGVNLSVGERQLIAFTRALAFDPSVLILDEATSSVDTKTEALIQDAIHKLLEGRTALIIAHRLSTVRDADRIIVLDNGRIVEEGTHAALMAKKGVYYGLYKLQFEHKI